MASKSPPGSDNAQQSTTLMSGNEAIALGAFEAGVHVATGYPGTPSTEILEALALHPEVDCEWSTNEKVAMEVGIGASLAGGRALVTMKHVGLNVAADPFFSAAYAGTNGGLVVVSADDPGMHSSQNEQDNRLIARAARVPMLEPSTAEEAKDFTKAAFSLSETYDTPILVRTTTRISHGNGEVPVGKRTDVARRPYQKNPGKYVMLPSHGRALHAKLELERIPALEKEAENWAQVLAGSDDLAVITSGAAFPYAREAFKDATILKLGMTNPIPRKLIKDFAEDKKRILVIEELEPYLEEQIRALHIPCEGKDKLPRYGELSVGLLRQAFLNTPDKSGALELPPIPPRPPVLCAGCAHRGPFYVLGQLDAIVSGDIGCYTLGALAPLDAMDTCMSMGASVGIAHGMEKVMTDQERRRLVSVIGDSTFFHSGITGLVDVLYNGGCTTTVILDNRTTAMTGHQEHPGSGLTLQKEKATQIDLEALCRGLGIKRVTRVDPYDLAEVWRTLDKELQADEPSVILAEADCALKEKLHFGDPLSVDREKCTECMACTRLGCPAIEIKENRLEISDLLCVGCVHCQQICSDCNAGIDLPQVLELVDQKRPREAFLVLQKNNPLPAVSSRICPRPCDHATNALGYDQGRLWAKQFPDLVADFPAPGQPSRISPCAVEKFLGDYGLSHFTGNEFAPSIERDLSVGIIGSGPAGLSAAWQLRQRGLKVTVYEASPEPGGMLRYGIPEFRLPKALLKKEIDRLVAAGVVFSCNTRIGKGLAFDRVTDTHDATIVCVGNGTPKDLPLKGLADIEKGLLHGVDFLRDINCDLPVEIGPRVGVIGGGNTAIDCARSAHRLKAEVTVYYRRAKDDMTAIPEEIDAAMNDGVRFEFHTAPVALLQKDGCLTGATIQPMTPGSLDRRGRRRPEPAEDNAVQVPLDTLILAVGEQSDLTFLEDTNVAFGKNVEVNFIGATTRPGVFACGDAAFSHGTVTQAISTGRRAAEAVEAFLHDRKGRAS